MNSKYLKSCFFIGAGALALSHSVLAQEKIIEEVVTTGTSLARTAFDTPSSVNTFDDEDLHRLAASSNADLLRSVPGISAEGGGGEIAVNVFIPGLIAAGQYSFTPLNFDGFTTFSYFGLNQSALDVYYRPDLGIERVEFVRGGASNLFGPGSTAGIINYISRQGSDEPESTMQFEFAEDGRVATNFATSGPFSTNGNNYYALSGYYRYDEGPIKTGLETQGYQLRGNFKHVFEDGSGLFSIYAQAIDDDVQFFLPVPLDAQSQDYANGNNNSEVRTIQTNQLENFVYPTANGLSELRLGNGVETSGGTLAFELEKEYGAGWAANFKAKYSKYEHRFNLFIPAGGNNVLTGEQFLEQQGLSGYDRATFTVLDTGETLRPDDLVYRSQAWGQDRPATDFTIQFDLSKIVESNSLSHNITGGLWFSRAVANDFNNRIFYLGEFNDQPRLLGLALQGDNANTEVVETGTTYYSINGFAGSGGHVNNGGSVNRLAVYLADQVEADQWSFDIGVRLEHLDGEYYSEGVTSIAINPALYGLGPDVQLASNLQNDTTGNGRFNRLEVNGSAVAFALAGVYRLSDSYNFYGNYSHGFFWPQMFNLPGQVNTAAANLPLNQAIDLVEDAYEEETVDRVEAGMKFNNDIIDGSLGIYYQTLKDNIFFQNVEQVNGTFVPTSIVQDTQTYGIDASGNVFVTEVITLNFNFSYADHEVTAGPNDGNEINRQPNVIGTTELLFDNDVIDASLSYSYRGESFGNSANTVELDEFGFWRASIGYTLELDSDEQLHFGLSVFNITDEVGLTEGNPRAGAGAASDFQVGRPILPRRTTFKLTYRF